MYKFLATVWVALALVACGGGGGGGGNPPADPPPEDNPPAPVSLSVTAQGSGAITSSPAGIDCGSTCSAQFAANTVVTLTATPAAGESFGGWSGDCAGTASCTVTMNANKSVRAVFAAPPTTGWQEQLLVSGEGSFNHGYPQVAMTADGSALSVWLQAEIVGNVQTGYIVRSSRYTPGAGWSTPLEVTRVGNSITNGGEDPLRLALNATGRGVLAWKELRSGTTQTYDVSAMPADTLLGWGARSVISITTSTVSSLQVGVDGTGNSFVSWLQAESNVPLPEYGVWARRYSVADSWGAAQVLSADTTDGVERPKLAVLSAGDAIVAWNNVGRSARIRTAKYTAGGSWGPSEVRIPVVAVGVGTVGSNMAIAADSNGGALLVWVQFDQIGTTTSFQSGLWSLRYANGAWASAPTPASTPWSASNSWFRTAPSLVVNGAGQAVLGWSPAETTTQLWVNRSRTDGTWEGQQLANSGVIGNADLPQIGIDDSGNMTAVWYNSSSPALLDNNIMTNRFTSGGGWSVPQRMAVYDPSRNTLAAASFAFNGRGNAVLAYQLNTNPLIQGSQVFSRYYAP